MSGTYIVQGHSVLPANLSKEDLDGGNINIKIKCINCLARVLLFESFEFIGKQFNHGKTENTSSKIMEDLEETEHASTASGRMQHVPTQSLQAFGSLDHRASS